MGHKISWLLYSTLSPNISIRRSVRAESPQEIHKLSINLSHWSFLSNVEVGVAFVISDLHVTGQDANALPSKCFAGRVVNGGF